MHMALFAKGKLGVISAFGFVFSAYRILRNT
jgi:hypothetical protein